MLFTQYETICDLPLSAVTVSLHHLPKISEVSSQMQKNALITVIGIEPLKIRCHVVKTTKSNSRTTPSQVLQR